MHEAYDTILDIQLASVKTTLEKHNFPTYIVENKQTAIEVVNNLIQDGEHVAVGGSQTLIDCGILEALRKRNIDFKERDASASEEEKRALAGFSFLSDTYLCSANALTMNGEIYNVDGRGNRVCNIMYGPKQVVLIVGYNKLVANMQEAITRLKRIAAPINCTRLQCDTPCTKFGSCVDCLSPQRICCSHVVMNFQQTQRIKVILVKERLGF